LFLQQPLAHMLGTTNTEVIGRAAFSLRFLAQRTTPSGRSLFRTLGRYHKPESGIWAIQVHREPSAEGCSANMSAALRGLCCKPKVFEGGVNLESLPPGFVWCGGLHCHCAKRLSSRAPKSNVVALELHLHLLAKQSTRLDALVCAPSKGLTGISRPVGGSGLSRTSTSQPRSRPRCVPSWCGHRRINIHHR